MSNYRSAALMIDAFSRAKALLANRGYDAEQFRDAVAMGGIGACFPRKSRRSVTISHFNSLLRQRHTVKTMFGKLMDLRRVHTHSDQCTDTFRSAICIATTVTFWQSH